MTDKEARKPRYYYTYNRACLVVRRLKIKTWQSYRKRHKEDRRLPAHPEHYYEQWVNWPTFFGEKYGTLKEASNAVKSLGIKSFEQYRQHYKKDSRLPGDPAVYYKNEWAGWPLFVGKGQYSEKYPTFQEASIAAQSLGIEDREGYERFHREDPKLPSTPHKHYKDEWPDYKPWFQFLGKPVPYRDYEAAKTAVQLLGVRSRRDYLDRYQFDSKLPASPESVYKNKGWQGWDSFLGKC